MSECRQVFKFIIYVSDLYANLPKRGLGGANNKKHINYKDKIIKIRSYVIEDTPQIPPSNLAPPSEGLLK